MKRFPLLCRLLFRLPLLLSCLLALRPGGAGAQSDRDYSFIDDQGREIVLPAPARRIIPRYAAFTEILQHLGLEDRIIARTASDNLPAALPTIGTHLRPNLELIYGLGPDLVLQMRGREEAGRAAETLRGLGVQVAVFDVRDFADLFRVIRTIGRAAGAEEEADRLAAGLAARLEAVRAKTAALPGKPVVFYELRYPNLIAAGPGSMPWAIIEAAGGRNLFEAEGPAFRRVLRVSQEKLLWLDPDVYLIQRGPMNKNPQLLEQRPNFQSLKACRSRSYLLVDEFEFSRPGPGNIRAVEDLARYLHPQLFDGAAANAE